jgi:hypothetical protein
VKRIFVLTVFAALFLGSQFLMNCSSPLDSSGGFTPSPPGGTETLYVHDTVFLGDSICDTVYDTLHDTVIIDDTACDSISDTVFVIDTVEIIDTLFGDTIIDTIIVTDTVLDSIIIYDTIFDTVFVPGPDSCDNEPICVEFNKHNRKIYWKLNNAEGMHNLEFTANFGEGCFEQILHIHVKGKKYEWDPKIDPVFTLDADLRRNAKIMIHCKKQKDDDGDDRQGGDYDDDNDCDDGGGDDDDDDDNGNGDKDCCNVEVCLKVTKL